jgi:serine/threonine protein kinase
MASFAHALRSFRSGSLSQQQLFEEVERILRDGRGDENWLLQTLEEENTKVPLPAEIHSAVKNRIEQAAERKRADQGIETGSGDGFDPDASRTRLATQFVAEGARAPQDQVVPLLSRAAGGAVDAAPPEVERIKGLGDVLNDRFVLEDRVGSGGMSTVYKALDRRKLEADDRNPYVAVKVLNLEFRSHPQSLMALQREAKKSQSLAHPNIVRVYDFDRDGATVYMTMEYLSGKSLAQILRAPDFKGMPQDQAVVILEQIADALKFAHDNGIVHADFKPANVILTDSGQVKVIDFGIARAFQRPDQADLEATRFDPGSLGALTPTYASPEMLEHQEVDPRDDVYALGCIAYEMFTGRHPFGRMQATEARDGGLQLERRKGLKRKQWKAIKSALAFDRNRRTATVRQFCNDIRCEGLMAAPLARFGGIAASLLVVAGATLYYYNSTSQSAPWLAASQEPTVPSTDFGSIEVTVAPRESRTANTKGGEAEPLTSRVAVAALEKQAPNGHDAQSKQAEKAPLKPKPADLQKLSLSAVMPVLDQVPCAALNATLSDGNLKLEGYVSSQVDVQGLRRELLALPGAQQVEAKLTRVSEAKCAVLDVYEPYWRTNKTLGRNTTIRTRAAGGELTEGDPLVVKITTPPYKSYVNVDYFSLDGGVVHLVPGPRVQANQAPANYAATIGDLGEWIIAEPFGSELVVVLTTPRPLFDQLRKEAEPGADYLKALRERLERMGKQWGVDKIAADFVIINTKSK